MFLLSSGIESRIEEAYKANIKPVRAVLNTTSIFSQLAPVKTYRALAKVILGKRLVKKNIVSTGGNLLVEDSPISYISSSHINDILFQKLGKDEVDKQWQCFLPACEGFWEYVLKNNKS
jgi:hypothetical protein